jgi:hypothetical protein
MNRYIVELQSDPVTGVVRREDWFTAESWPKHHRLGGPASIQRDPSGMVVHETWFQNGELHRDGAPAFIDRDPVTGTVFWESWYQNGLPHRDGAPAKIRRNSVTGIVIREKWCLHGRLHRIDGPAIICRHPTTGKITSSSWRVNGEDVCGDQRREMVKRWRTAPQVAPPSPAL